MLCLEVVGNQRSVRLRGPAGGSVVVGLPLRTGLEVREQRAERELVPVIQHHAQVVAVREDHPGEFLHRLEEARGRYEVGSLDVDDPAVEAVDGGEVVELADRPASFSGANSAAASGPHTAQSGVTVPSTGTPLRCPALTHWVGGTETVSCR